MKIRTITHLALTFICSSILFSCNEDEQPDQSGQLISNGDVEIGSGVPNSWFYDTGLDLFEVTWNDQVSFSPTKSLEISTQTGDPDNFAFWGQTIYTNLPLGKKVTLKVKIKANLIGTGVSIAILGENPSPPSQFVTTQGISPISGVFDWTEYSVTLNKVDATIQSLSVFLVYLPNTTGEVYFDDIELVY